MRKSINPKLSVWAGKNNPQRHDKLKESNLYTALKRCEEISIETPKGEAGQIFPFVASTIGSEFKSSNGVLFIDFDHCAQVSQQIYDSFDELCKVVPNLLAVNFSHSRNLHFFMYDEDLKYNSDKYTKFNLLNMCRLAVAIKNVCGIDLREIEGCMDTHSKSIAQRFFLAHSEFKYNVHCCHCLIKKKEEEQLRAEYHKVLNPKLIVPVSGKVERSKIELENTGTLDIDQNFILNSSKGPVCGYDARTLIAAATYFHFNNDLNEAAKYIYSKYANGDVIYSQMESMAHTGSIYRKYDRMVEDILFPEAQGVELKENEFLSDKINLRDLLKQDKYIYICSNTGTGKTELVKMFLYPNYNPKTQSFEAENFKLEPYTIEDKQEELAEEVTEGEPVQIFYLQMMKSILNGKKQGIEDITITNDQVIDQRKVSNNVHIHMTIDKLLNAFKNIRPKNTILIIDESHLLQDHIGFRKKLIQKMCKLLSEVQSVVFLSATPKADADILPFKRYNFTKKQDQTVTIRQIPIELPKQCNKDATYFTYLISDIEMRAKDRYITIFTNKNEQTWLDSGLKVKDLTRFRADYKDDDKVISVLEDNRLLTKWCIATSYMSVGVEIKHGKHLVVIDAGEGVDIAFIIQAIGRFRSGYIKELEVLIYYRAEKQPFQYIKDDDKEVIKSAWENLFIVEEGQEVFNLVSGVILSLKDIRACEKKNLEMFKVLKNTHIYESYNLYTPHAACLLQRLPYKKIEVYNEEIVKLTKKGVMKYSSGEDELITYLKSLSHSSLLELGEIHYDDNEGYDRIWRTNEVPYNDRVSARKIIVQCKDIARMGMPLKQALNYFNDNVKEAYDYTQWLKIYVKLERKEQGMKVFKGAETAHAELLKDLEKMKNVFTEDFIQWCIKDEHVGVYAEKNIDAEIEQLLIAGARDMMEFLGVDEDTFFHKEKTEYQGPGVEIFKGKNIKDARRKNSLIGKQLGGLKSSPKKKVTLKNTETGEVKTFDSKGEAMNYINVSTKSFSKIMKGLTVKNCPWGLPNDFVRNLSRDISTLLQ